MDKETLIKKWLNDELSPAEKQAFEQGEDFAFYQAIIDNASHFKASNVSEPESFQEFQSAYQDKTTSVRSLRKYGSLLRIAAVLVIAFGVYFALFHNSSTEVQTLVAQQTTVELPDATQVILNADSKIEYNTTDWKADRQVSLDGEAYFKVAKGARFDVLTSQGTVSVVGTEFNVKQRNDYFEVQCYEGVVNVSSGNISKTLRAGDIYRRLNDKFSQDKTTLTAPHWTQNRSMFKAIPFESVIAEMERQYNIKITLEHVNADRLFTGGFMHNDIEKALLSITQPMGLNYRIKASNDVVIHGNKE